jgi:hypothetical protein
MPDHPQPPRSASAEADRRKERVMQRKFLTAALMICAVGLVSVPVASSATGNAHFIKHATGAGISGSSLTCSFKEAGLASGSVETVTCNATVATTYECVNGGGKNPAASNKKTFVTTVSQSGQFTADKNGNIVGSLTLSPPSASSLGFSCPPGQTTTFVSVSYSGVSVTDNTSGASQSVPGSFSYTNPAAPPIR